MVEFQTLTDSPGPHAALALRSRLAGLRVMSAAIRLHGLARKAGFDPNQPRVPRGHPDGGQWTSTGGSDEGRVLSDATPDNFWKPGTRVAQATGGLYARFESMVNGIQFRQRKKRCWSRWKAKPALH